MGLVNILESDTVFGLGAEMINENVTAMNEVEQISEDVRDLLSCTVEKVVINATKSDPTCYIEYANNLERFIADQKLFSIEEAVSRICEHYDLSEDNIAIVVDESCIGKLDISELKDKYHVVKR